MESHKRMLLANRAWAHEKASLKPGFFDSLSRGQTPDFLWIGCSDSRVPAEEITGVESGEIFVHRNIANIFVESDLNANSVLQYAVEVLRVKHIIVCGHYGCGGVNAVLSSTSYGDIDTWLAGVKEIKARNERELESLPGDHRLNRLVELSVKEQVSKLTKSVIIRKAWETNPGPLVHGWVFGIQDGLLRALTCVGPKGLEHLYF